MEKNISIKIERIVNVNGYRSPLFSELLQILKPSYHDATILLQRELSNHPIIYLGSLEGVVTCFFMVRWGSIVIGGSSKQCVYLGLSASKIDLRNVGHIKHCYTAFIADARQWERENKQELVLWATTATPLAYYMAIKLFRDVNPKMDGSASEESRAIALSIREMHYPTKLVFESELFCLKGVAANTKYSTTEDRRIQTIIDKRKFEIFRILGIEESQGDRLLMVLKTPH